MDSSILLDISSPPTKHNLDPLPDVHPRFLVPHLTDKPQNPIMDTLRVRLNSKNYPGDHVPMNDPELPAEHVEPSTDILCQSTEELQDSFIWHRAAVQSTATRNCAMSWDSLRPTFTERPLPPAFLSQQSTPVFASVWHHIRPPLRDTSARFVYISAKELFQSLRMILTGSTSPICVWDMLQEKFEVRGVEAKEQGIVIITGKDQTMSASIIKRFLTIGTITRRLETLIDSLRGSRVDPILHAFTYAMSTMLEHLRQHVLTDAIPLDDDAPAHADMNIVSTWLRYAQAEESLKALAMLCRRDETIVPQAYELPPSYPAELLSSIYNHLNEHIEQQRPRYITALFAYLLTMTSQEYMSGLGRSVGLGSSSVRSVHPSDVQYDQNGRHESIFTDHDAPEPEFQSSLESIEDEGRFPCFIEDSVSDSIVRARRALKLLRVAQPDHPLLRAALHDLKLKWIWAEEEIETVWNEAPGDGSATTGRNADVLTFAEQYLESDHYPSGLEAFNIFDLAPGSHFQQRASTPTLSSSPAVLHLQAFVEHFPDSLPSLTPTLPHVTKLVLSPLVRHIDALSSALVSVLLSPSTPLYLSAHLTLLRSYLLLTSPSFKSKVVAALFSSLDDFNVVDSVPRTIASRRARSRSRSRRHSSKRWAVGLAKSLIEDGSWPPAGTDLSFHLRTVVLDSLEDGWVIPNTVSEYEARTASEKIKEEAEWRVGFAIRDLAVVTGKEKWLDPSAIEALDFLYLDYKPPPPLDTVITPDILSKYHRIFSFNLRLLRVESALGVLYRMTRSAADPLFPTLTPSNKLLLHFRFVAHAFVNSLSSYVYDTAIGSTFDELLSRASSTEKISRDSNFSDIFAVAEYHSRVLDDILSACLLRSGQKAVGDVLRTCLELVLELCVLAGDLKRGVLQEYEAAPLLDELWKTFRTKMTALVRGLKDLLAKGSSHPLDDAALQLKSGFEVLTYLQADGVAGKWHDLLVRLDVGEWWSRRSQKV